MKRRRHRSMTGLFRPHRPREKFAAPSLDAGQTRAIARNLVQRVNVEIMLNSKLRRESDFVGAIGL
jgi:hypothetical protein